MAGDDSRSGDASGSDTLARVRQIVRECVRKWADGQPVDGQALIEAHPELAPALAEELGKLRLVLDAAEKTIPALREHGGEAATATLPGPRRGIPVRCPHCRHTFEVLTDADLSGITCDSCGTTFNLVDEAMATDEAPPLKRVGHFEIVSRLGRGGYGTVWKARDLELGRTVAVKIPRTDHCDAREQEKFLREARAAAQLRHSNIVAIHEVGREESTPYIVCDMVRGVTLAEWLEAHQPGPREAATLCVKIAAALQHAHDAGVVHRDLKPPNIMMDAEGEPHVMDFGIAKWEAGGMTVAQEGEPLGTAAYMSPEQAEGKGHDADARSDVYSLGVILFELLTRELPFRGSRRAILHQVIHDEPPSPRKLNASVPRDLETICLKCLEKRPEARIGSAAEVGNELKRYLEGRPIQSRPIGMVQRTVRAARRRPAVAAVAVLIALIAIAGPVVAGLLNVQLHEAKLREAELLILSGEEGYQTEAFERLREAQQLFVLDQQRDRQRELAAAALGNFVGHNPIEIPGEAGFDKWIVCLAFNEDATRIAVGLMEGRIAVFDACFGLKIASFIAHPQPAQESEEAQDTEGAHVRAIRFIPATDGEAEPPLMSVASDGTVATSTWTGETYKPTAAPRQLDMAGIWSARFSRDGSRFVAQTRVEAALWETTSWKRLTTFEPPAEFLPELGEYDGLTSIALSPDDAYVVAGYHRSPDDCVFFVWDASSGKLVDRKSGRGGTYEEGVAFTPDGSLLALGSERLIKYEMPPPLSRYDVHGGDEISCVAFHPYASYEAVYHWNNKFTIRNWVVNQELMSLDIPNSVGREAILFSENGRRLALSTGESVRIWDLEVSERRTWIGHEDASGVAAIVFSPNCNLLVSAGKDQMVRIWDAKTGRESHPPLRLGGKIQCLAFSPDGMLLAVGMWGKSEENLTVFRTSDWKAVETLDHKLGDKICGLDFGRGRDGKDSYLLAASGVGVSLWEVKLGKNPQRKVVVDIDSYGRSIPPSKHDDGATPRESRYLQFSPTGSYVAWVELGLVRVADCRTESLASHDLAWLIGAGYHGLAFGEDDTSLAFIGESGNPELWDVTSKTSQPEQVISDVGDRLTSSHLALSPDGRYLAALVDTRSVGIWDVRTGKRLFVLRPETSDIWSLAWSHDRRLAVGTAAGEISVWDMNAIADHLEEVNLAPAGLAIVND